MSRHRMCWNLLLVLAWQLRDRDAYSRRSHFICGYLVRSFLVVPCQYPGVQGPGPFSGSLELPMLLWWRGCSLQGFGGLRHFPDGFGVKVPSSEGERRLPLDIVAASLLHLTSPWTCFNPIPEAGSPFLRAQSAPWHTAPWP